MTPTHSYKEAEEDDQEPNKKAKHDDRQHLAAPAPRRRQR